MPLANIEDILEAHDKKVKEGMDYIVVTPSMISKRKREGWESVTTLQGTVDQMLVVMERKTPPLPKVELPLPPPVAAKPATKPVVKETKPTGVRVTRSTFGYGHKKKDKK